MDLLMCDRGSQARLALKCMFPRYADWVCVDSQGREIKRLRSFWEWVGWVVSVCVCGCVWIGLER